MDVINEREKRKPNTTDVTKGNRMAVMVVTKQPSSWKRKMTRWCIVMFFRKSRVACDERNCWRGHSDVDVAEGPCWHWVAGGGICMLLCTFDSSWANKCSTWLRKCNLLIEGSRLTWGTRDLKRFISSSSSSDFPESFLVSISNSSFSKFTGPVVGCHLRFLDAAYGTDWSSRIGKGTGRCCSSLCRLQFDCSTVTSVSRLL